MGWLYGASPEAAVLFRRMRKNMPKPMRARVAMPPMTPPTMAPIGVECLELGTTIGVTDVVVAVSVDVGTDVEDTEVIGGPCEFGVGVFVASYSSSNMPPEVSH